MSIIIKQAEDKWLLKLYNEKWNLRQPELDEIKKTFYKDVDVRYLKLGYNMKTEMPSMEISFKTLDEARDMLKLVLGFKEAFGQSDFKMLKQHKNKKLKTIRKPFEINIVSD